MPEIGSFEVEIEAFEDLGATWRLPLFGALDRLQFPRVARRAPAPVVDELRAAAQRFARPLEVAADPRRRESTLERIAELQLVLRRGFLSVLPSVDLAVHIDRREGSAELMGRFSDLLAEHGLSALDAQFARAFVSNPQSGEIVKGHAIVLAELGLCPYRGTIVRDPDTFAEPWTKAERERHLILRIAATQGLWTALGHPEVVLYRGAASEIPLAARRPGSFVSATFSEEVAHEHYRGGDTTHTAVLCRQRVPGSRLLMTFLETPALNDPYREAEAILLGEPENPAF